MKSDITCCDELWELEPPTTNSPSRLFHLEPIGIGTFYVESLTSYVARLAEAHSVPPGTLLAIEVKPMVRHSNAHTPQVDSIVALYAQDSVKALNGTQAGAKQLVKALEALTKRNDLKFLTMLPWAEVFPVLGLLKHFHTWCPYCYQEWLNNKQVIYSPLLWALKPVKICPIHHQLLESIDTSFVSEADEILISEIYDELENQYLFPNEGDINVATEAKRDRLMAFAAQNPFLGGFDIKRSESIAIDLEQILRSPGKDEDLALRHGDIITIPEELKTVRLRGRVLYPNTVRYEKGKKVNHYISKAGGFGARAKKNKTYLVFANGEVARTRQFLFFSRIYYT